MNSALEKKEPKEEQMAVSVSRPESYKKELIKDLILYFPHKKLSIECTTIS
jgi:hypothetical protein